jgi:hypothetical protein
MQLLLVLGVSLLFLLPPLLWNWRHDWITFRHTADELSDNPFRWARSLKLLAEFIGGQAGLGGGVTWALMVVAVLGVVVHWRSADERSRFLACFCFPGWLAFTALAVHQRVEQNWPLVFYSGAVVLAAARFGGEAGNGEIGGRSAVHVSSRWIPWALGLGGIRWPSRCWPFRSFSHGCRWPERNPIRQRGCAVGRSWQCRWNRFGNGFRVRSIPFCWRPMTVMWRVRWPITCRTARKRLDGRIRHIRNPNMESGDDRRIGWGGMLWW